MKALLVERADQATQAKKYPQLSFDCFYGENKLTWSPCILQSIEPYRR